MFKPCLYFIAIAVLFQLGCDSYGDCEMYDGRDGDVIKDTLYLEPGKEYYIQKLPQLAFNNGVGTIIFDSSKTINNLGTLRVSSGIRKTSCGDEVFDEVVAVRQNTIAYNSSPVPLQLSITRRKRTLSLPVYDTGQVNRWMDIVVVNLGNRSFLVPLDGKQDTMSTFYTSYTLGTKSYDSVYQCNTYTYNYAITPKTVFYNTKEGLLGYELSNGELWIRQ